LPYCSDDALRYGKSDSYETLDRFMAYALQLHPTFLILHQFNEFNSSDEGWDADTNDDIEPANQWGIRSVEVVKAQLDLYRREPNSEDRPAINNSE
jgi:hypothetical protein